MSSSSSNTNDNLMKNEASMMFYCALAALSSFNLFHENEWKKKEVSIGKFPRMCERRARFLRVIQISHSKSLTNFVCS